MPRNQVWRIGTDGKNPVKAAIPDDLLTGVPEIDISDDGTTCMAAFGYTDAEGGLSTRLFFIDEEGAASLFLDTFEEASGPAWPLPPRLTDDGDAVLFLDDRTVWRSDPLSGTFMVGDMDQIYWETVNPIQGFNGLDISANGGAWMSFINFPIAGGDVARALVVGMSIPVTEFVTVLEGGSNNITWFEIADDGMELVYCDWQPEILRTCYHRGTDGVISALQGGPDQVNAPVLADGGGLLHATFQVGSSTFPFMEDTETGRRWPGQSTRFVDAAGGGQRSLSDDGRVMLARADLDGDFVSSFWGLYVLEDGAAPGPEDPALDDVFYRYDGEGNLILRVESDTAADLERIYLLPYKDGYLDPTALVEDADNPFFHERWGGGVNFSTVFAEREEEVGVWERTVTLNAPMETIDDTYSLRIVAVDAGGDRISFVDIAL